MKKDKKKKTKIISKNLKPFKIKKIGTKGVTIKTLRTKFKGEKTTYSYEFKVYSGKTWKTTKNYRARNLRNAKKKLTRDLKNTKIPRL